MRSADAEDSDEQALRSANLSSDGPVLLDYLRKQTALAARPDQIQELVRNLGADDYFTREKASASLVALGRVALSLLEDAAKDTDAEVKHRAAECVRLIKQDTVAALPSAVIRLVGKKKPDGAAEVLLAYLPHVDNETIAEEARNALAAVALRHGRLEPAVKAALADANPVRRAAAAEAVARAGSADERSAVVALLKDPEPSVRLRVALTLAPLKEKQAIGVLIDLLAQLKPEQLWSAEELLFRLAGEQAPAVSLGESAAARSKCRDAWAAWWKDNEAKVDLAKLTQPPALLGHTVVVLLDRHLVMELDRDNKPRWTINNIQFPLDVQPLPGDRVLLAEQSANRVTERDHKGNILWQKDIEAPIVAQRLRSGNTFIASQSVLTEVDRTGKQLYTHALPGGSLIMRAQKLPNGDIACITSSKLFLRLDAKGKILGRFSAGVDTSGGRVDVLRNGHVLVPHMYENRVVEYDGEGRVVWQASVSQPIAALRLPNGNTMVTSMNQLRAIELDRAGKEVWTYRSDTRVTRAIRR
jgi:HEAT repeat protein